MFKIGKREKKQPQNSKEVLVELDTLAKKLESVSGELKALVEKSKGFVQRVGIVRFSPFPEVGGDQSFSIALLDENNNGIVLTSLYSRETSRVYAKPIKAGQSSYVLSNEEKEAITRAQNINSQPPNPKPDDKNNKSK